MKRRHFLQAAGLTLTLPALESLGGAADLEAASGAKRLLLMTDGYGFYTPHFYPKSTGTDWESNEVTKSLEPLRSQVSILGNLKHLNGHAAQKFVAAGSPKSAGFQDSVDQFAARHLSQQTPIDSLLLSTRTQATGGSFRNRIPVAMMYDPEEIFDSLFTKGDVKSRSRKLARRQSMLDLCLAEAKALSKSVSVSDQKRLDEYFNSIRETEKLVRKDQRFLNEPAIDPVHDRADFTTPPADGTGGEEYFRYLRSQLRFIELAFKFDLTRVAYLWEHGRMHGATHHGNRPGPIKSLTTYATSTVENIADLLTSLSETKMPGGNSLLDETLFVWTAALGSAAAHKGVNIPAILAGGGLDHGQYTHFDQEQKLTSLHLTVLQKLGIEAGRFCDSEKTLNI